MKGYLAAYGDGYRYGRLTALSLCSAASAAAARGSFAGAAPDESSGWPLFCPRRLFGGGATGLAAG